MSREALYVAVTRARIGGQLLVPAADSAEAREWLADALGRVGEHHAALDLLTDRLDTARGDARRGTGHGSELRGSAPAPTGADPAGDTTGRDRTAWELAAERARQTADEQRQRRDQLRPVLGTDTSPARRALAARRADLDRADQQLRTALARRNSAGQAQQAALAAFREADRHGTAAERPRVALRLAGTSRAEQQRLAAEHSAVGTEWQRQAEHDRAEAAAAHDTAWRAAQQAAGVPLRRDVDLRVHLTRVRAALTGPDAVRAADRADQQAFAQLGRDLDRLTEQAARLRPATRSEPGPLTRDVDADAEPAVRSHPAGGHARTYAGDQGEAPENVAPGEQDAAYRDVPDADRRRAAEQRAAQLADRIRAQRAGERPQANRGPEAARRGSPTRKGNQMHQRTRSHDRADQDERSAERPAATPPAGAEAQQLVDQSFPQPARSRVRPRKQAAGPAEPSPEVRAAEIRRRIERSRQHDRDQDRGLGR
ncbi:MAG: hypothetical protein ACXV5Q_09365 [Frankiaceae bacterium]